jgi:hypothetical protein
MLLGELGNETLLLHLEQGRKMTLDAAVALALDGSGN